MLRSSRRIVKGIIECVVACYELRKKRGGLRKTNSGGGGLGLGTLRDWEQGRAQPDRPTQAYLKIIACEPEKAERLLNAR
jgi:putative transcriptional regulator